MAASKLRIMTVLSEILIVIIRVIYFSLLTISLKTVLPGGPKEAHETVLNIAISNSLELLEYWAVSNGGSPEHFALFGLFFIPSANEVL